MKALLKQILAMLVGFILTIIGLIWVLQGTAILHLCPVLCFADCECITGQSLFWAVAGVIAVVIGITIVYLSVRNLWDTVDNRKKN